MERKKKEISIIKQCILGNTMAQMQFYDTYHKTMFHTALRMLHDKGEAEETMQEAFLKAFGNLQYVIDKQIDTEPWLRRIVINHCIDVLRSRKMKFTNVDETYIADVEDEEDIDFEELNDQVEIVKKCIAELPDGYRIIMNMYLFEGFDHEEIAKVLGITSSTSRSQYTRGKKLLIKNIKKHLSYA